MDSNLVVEEKRELVLESMRLTLIDMKKAKPNDRSERDRYAAIAITDLEKLIAFYSYYC